MFTRRQFIISGVMLAAGLAWPKLRANAATSNSSHRRARTNNAVDPAVGRKTPIPGGTLDPMTITKYADPLIIPPAMPKASVITGPNGEEIDYYEIAARQFTQQILPAIDNFEKTTVWSYGSAVVSHGNTFNYPAFTIEGQVNRPVRVKWINDLVDENGHYLPHILPVDQTLHWANPGGGVDMRDDRGTDPTPYTGPVPMVTHVHGAHTHDDSDGYAEAWYLPAANNIPVNFATNGTFYQEFKQKAEARQGQAWEPGTAVFDYPNDQRATTIWYHDHSLGMTRSNVYAGPAGFFILRGGNDDLQDGSLPEGAYEIPIAIQDRSFDVVVSDGHKKPSLFYPASREFFDGFTGPFIPNPDSDIHPIWNPEFFGNTMVVNGRSWPKQEVERRRYRIRFLNGCNARFVILRMVTQDPAEPGFTYPNRGALPFWQIGAEGGFLDEPFEADHLLMSPAERADVIIDFSKLPESVTSVYLINEGPDEPFGGGRPGIEFARADLGTTGQIMRFDLVPSTSQDTTADPSTGALVLPTRQKLLATDKIRRVALMEMDSNIVEIGGEPFGPREAVLGTVEKNLFGNPIFIEKAWMDEITETPLAGDTEMWEIYNITADAHPIHVHQVMFEVVNREDRRTGEIRPPEPTEKGYKDTVIAYPDEITRIKARFDLPGLYAWHCHIVEHEDNEMMRPYRVLHRINFPMIGK